MGAGGAGLAALKIVAELYDDLKWYRDVIEAFHDALPEELQARGRKPTPQAMLAALYKSWDSVNVQKAVENVLEAYAWERAGGLVERLRNAIASERGDWKMRYRTYSFSP